ncbi:MAG: AGE family epimerase/isomerase [Caulobacteraceae bacterium]|nr:AGE family epimerase/isomerase [Caulobacteraceae bacterium]
MSASLADAAAFARSWLFDEALPLWAERGLDPAGGFHDQLDDAGQPVAAPKRARVQARQVMVFAEAGRLGWGGDWQAQVAHGLAFLRAQAVDGLAPTTFDPPGPIDLYDQAFVLLALSYDPGEDAVGEAGRLWRRLQQRFAGDPGFREPPPAPFPLQANPHMHLYEAVMAWRALKPAAPWREAAAMMRRLALETFVDPASGLLGEYFTADGESAADEVWPGHQYEWGWLLLHDAEGSASAQGVGERLIRLAGELGVDRAREAVVFSHRRDGRVIDGGARLWSQTERLRAVLAMQARHPREALWEAEALAAFATIRRYLETPGGGLYRDLMRPDGTFVAEPSKASTLYHLMSAFLVLFEAAR